MDSDDILTAVQEMSRQSKERVYTYSNLTPFEQIACFGWDHSYVSHGGLSTTATRRAAAFASNFEIMSTAEFIDETYTREVEVELDETDAKGNLVTTTKAVEETVSWPTIPTNDFFPSYQSTGHGVGSLKLDSWLYQAAENTSRTIGWTQINRAREVAEELSDGKVVHGTIDGNHMLIQTESLVLNPFVFDDACRQNPDFSFENPLQTENVVDAVTISSDRLEQFSYTGTNPEHLSINHLDYCPSKLIE